MSKFLYPIKNLEIMPWIKHWLLKRGSTPSYPLSEIIIGASPLTLINSVRKKFNIFNISGNTIQDGTPTPESPIPVENVSGEVEVKVANGTDSTAQGYQEQTATLSLPEGMEMCKIGTYQDSFVYQGGKWYKNKKIGKVVLNGGETWSWDALKHRSEIRWTNLGIKFMGQGGIYDKGLSNYFVNTNSEASIGFNFGGSSLFLCISKSMTDLTQFTNWLNTYNPIIYGILNTPALEEITDTTLISDLNNLKNLYSYKGTTHISSTNEPSPVFEVQYYMEGGDV